MMTDRQINAFCQKKFKSRSDRYFEFNERIKSDHVFGSINECIGFLYAIDHNNISAICGNIFCTSFEQAPVFTINAIEDSITAIIYELFNAKYRDDIDTLVHTDSILYTLIDDIIYSHEHIFYANGPCKEAIILSNISNVLCSIRGLCSPLYEANQEDILFKISVQYYSLMEKLYFFAYIGNNEEKEYFGKMHSRYVSVLNAIAEGCNNND